MKELIGERILLERGTGAEVTAQIFRSLDQKNFEDFLNRWRPMLKARRAECASWEAAAQINAQDSHWEWVEKAIEAERVMGRDTYAVEAAGETQGLMLVDVGFGRLAAQRGRELIYVELLATAPWNRPKLVEAPVYKGVGRILIGTAISLSVDLGFNGRIGLHSLAQSESWYQTVGGFSDVEFDAEKDMRYFEMTDADAATFMSD
jgi:hypothetical protein